MFTLLLIDLTNELITRQYMYVFSPHSFYIYFWSQIVTGKLISFNEKHIPIVQHFLYFSDQHDFLFTLFNARL